MLCGRQTRVRVDSYVLRKSSAGVSSQLRPAFQWNLGCARSGQRGRFPWGIYAVQKVGMSFLEWALQSGS